MAEPLPILMENAVQIARDYLERTGELGDPEIASRFLLDTWNRWFVAASGVGCSRIRRSRPINISAASISTWRWSRNGHTSPCNAKPELT